jgi:hypothetical protein
MDSDGSRRFTDKEVAIVLRKASELEDQEGEGGGSGLSLEELEDIAAEVGISREVMGRAVAHLDSRSKRLGPLSGGPLTHRAIQAVPGELDEEARARLIEYVNSTSDTIGATSEALGSTQWTSVDRFRSTQVSITPARGETNVQVVERASTRLRRMAHLLPASLAAAVTAGSIGVLEPSSGAVAAFIAMGFAVGGTVGRVAWGWLSAQSADRVERLAGELSRQAKGEIEKAAEQDLS